MRAAARERLVSGCTWLRTGCTWLGESSRKTAIARDGPPQPATKVVGRWPRVSRRWEARAAIIETMPSPTVISLVTLAAVLLGTGVVLAGAVVWLMARSLLRPPRM